MVILEEREAAGLETSCRFYSRLMKKTNAKRQYRQTVGLFESMKRNGVLPDEYCYTTVMHACSQLKDAKMAQDYFQEMKQTEGLKISQYGYTTVIDACVRSGAFQRGMFYFEEMLLAGMEPQPAVYGALISGCRFMDLGPHKAAEKCTELLRDMQNRHIRTTVPVYGAAMTVYYEAGDVNNVLALYNLMKHHHQRAMDSGTYDMLFKLFSDGKQSMSYVNNFYHEMQALYIRPSYRSLSLLIRCAMKAGDWRQAWVFYEDMKNAGLRPTAVIYNCIIGSYVQAVKKQKHEPNVYAECRRVLEMMQESGCKPDTFTCSQFLVLCLWLKDLDEGVRLFNEMKEKGVELTVFTYTNLMKLYIELGNPADGLTYLEPCLQILNEMESQEMKLDSYVFATLLNACFRAKNADMVNSLVVKMQQHRIKFDSYIYNAIIRVWVAVGEQQRAMRLLITMREDNNWPSVVTYTTLLEGLVNNDHPIQEILDLIRRMQKNRVAPNDITRQVMEKVDRSNLRPEDSAFIDSFLKKS